MRATNIRRTKKNINNFLINCIEYGNIELIKSLLEDGKVDFRFKDENNVSILEIAKQYQNEEIIDFIKDKLERTKTLEELQNKLSENEIIEKKDSKIYKNVFDDDVLDLDIDNLQVFKNYRGDFILIKCGSYGRDNEIIQLDFRCDYEDDDCRGIPDLNFKINIKEGTLDEIYEIIKALLK